MATRDPSQGDSKTVCKSDVGTVPPLLCPSAAAWTAGRLFNELSYHMVRAWLFVDRDSEAEVKALCGELVLIVRQLHSEPGLQDSLRDAVKNMFAHWENMYASEWYSDDLFEANRDIAIRSRGDVDPAELQREWCRRLAQSPQDLVEKVRQAVEEQLDARQRLAMRSGAFVDQGVRPPQFYEQVCTGLPVSLTPHHFAAEPSQVAVVPPTCTIEREDATSLGATPRATNEADNMTGWAVSSAAQSRPEPVVGLPASRATEDRPGAGWIAELDQRSQQLELLPLLLPTTAAEKLTEPGEALRYVADIHSAAVHALQMQSDSNPGGQCRLAVDTNRLVAYLDGRGYPLPSPEAALVLKAIADENGNWISGADIVQEYSGLDEKRIDRLRRTLPQELQDAIESKRGCGCRLRVS